MERGGNDIVRKPEGKKPLGNKNVVGKDYIEMYLREIGWGGTDWIHLARDGEQYKVLFNMVINF
jgi:uncharacterized protein YebE (UPF0316 family)